MRKKILFFLFRKKNIVLGKKRVLLIPFQIYFHFCLIKFLRFLNINTCYYRGSCTPFLLPSGCSSPKRPGLTKNFPRLVCLRAPFSMIHLSSCSFPYHFRFLSSKSSQILKSSKNFSSSPHSRCPPSKSQKGVSQSHFTSLKKNTQVPFVSVTE